MRKKIYIVLTICLIVILAVVGGCTQQDQEQAEQIQQLENEETAINLGYVQWPGVTIKTHVVKKLAEYLGYEGKMTSGSQAIVFKGMDTGDIDVFLGNWMPTMKIHYDKYSEKGSVEEVTVNLSEVVYKTAVPKYVWDAGVKSLADLNDYPEKFDRTIYGIEPGNEGNLIIKKAIENNTYNLKDWTLKASSTAGMLSEVKRHIDNNEWVAFNGWKPHYMNVMFDIKYLEDPEEIWGSGERVLTVVRSGFEKDSPNFYKLLSQFKITADIQNKWIYDYKKEGKEPEVVAENWIAEHQDTVNEWVKGVKAIDGREAKEVISEKVEE